MASWSSQDLVDTSPDSEIDRFKRLRTDAAYVTVAACAIVERLDVIDDVPGCRVAVLVDVFLDSFFLETAEERLRHRVVPAIASSAHAGLQVIGLAEAPPRIAPVLRTLVRMNQRSARSPSTYGHQNGIEDQLTMNRRAGRPANDAT